MIPLALLCALSAHVPSAAPPAPVVDFNLRDAVGKTHRLADYADRQAVVVVFLAVDCPLAKLYTPRLVDVAREYDARGVSFLLIASRQETPRDLARYMRRHGVTFPVLRDIGGVATARFGAERSPEAFVLDRTGRVRYSPSRRPRRSAQPPASHGPQAYQPFRSGNERQLHPHAVGDVASAGRAGAEEVARSR